jgi:hypothetical protein
MAPVLYGDLDDKIYNTAVGQVSDLPTELKTRVYWPLGVTRTFRK